MQTNTAEPPSLTGFFLQLAAGDLDDQSGCADPLFEPWEKVEADLQQVLFAPRESYTFPLDDLIALDRGRMRRRGKETSYSTYRDVDLFHALWGVYRHKHRGLSEAGWECQREFESRLCGVGWVRSLTSIDLPDVYAGSLGQGRSRRLIVRLLMLADTQGWLGVYGPSSQLCRALRINPSTWWRSVAWLEEHGWIRRVRSYKSPKHASKATVDFSRNGYIPGPTLLLWRSVYRSELGEDRSAFIGACRKERWFREGRQAYDAVPTVGEDLVRYASSCTSEIYLSDVSDRARTLHAGQGSWEPVDPAKVEMPGPWWERVEAIAELLNSDPAAGNVYGQCVVVADRVPDEASGSVFFTLSQDDTNSPRGVDHLDRRTAACTASPAAAAVDTQEGGCSEQTLRVGLSLALGRVWSNKVGPEDEHEPRQGRLWSDRGPPEPRENTDRWDS